MFHGTVTWLRDWEGSCLELLGCEAPAGPIEWTLAVA